MALRQKNWPLRSVNPSEQGKVGHYPRPRFAMRLLSARLSFSLLTLCACGTPTPQPGGKDASADTDSDWPPDDTGADAVSPCADGSWGGLTDPDLAIHVRADGDDAADGTAGSPVATLAQALALTRLKGGPKAIFVGPGSWETNLSLAADAGDGASDNGLSVLGCSAAEVNLQPADHTLPIIKVSAVEGAVIDGLTLENGRRSLWIWQGAQVALSRLEILGSSRIGLVIDGSLSIVNAVDVNVTNTESDGGAIGYGISVHDGTLQMSGGGVFNAEQIGILVDFGHAEFDGITVQGVSADETGLLGRGIQLQDLSDGNISASSVLDASDAGLFVLRPNQVVLTDMSISSTTESAIPGISDTSGDGIVVTRGSSNVAPSTFLISLTANDASACARAGYVLSGVQVQALDGNTWSGNGFTSGSIVVQDSAVIASGADAVYDIEAEGLDALPLNNVEVSVDDLIE